MEIDLVREKRGTIFKQAENRVGTTGLKKKTKEQRDSKNIWLKGRRRYSEVACLWLASTMSRRPRYQFELRVGGEADGDSNVHRQTLQDGRASHCCTIPQAKKLV